MTPYVTVYNTETGEAQRIYHATLREFLATGLYVTERPDNAHEGPSLSRAGLPTAGRESDRRAPILDRNGTKERREKLSEEKVEVTEKSEVEGSAPSKPAPKRRAATGDKEKAD